MQNLAHGSQDGELLVLSDEVVQNREHARSKLRIESDMRQMSLSIRSYRDDDNCTANAESAFADAIAQSDLASELTDSEAEEFKKRFIQEMLFECKKDGEIQAHWTAKVAAALEHEKPVMTDALAKSINDANLGFTVSTEWEHEMSSASYESLLGLKVPAEVWENENKTSILATSTSRSEVNAPATLDPVAKWPQCKETITSVQNQGTCGSCWAFGTGSAMDVRMCIASNGKFGGSRGFVSKGHLATCAQSRDGCGGGYWQPVFDLFSGKVSGQKHGVVLGTDKGCLPYFGHGSGADHFNSKSKAPPCQQRCAAIGGQKYFRTFDQDLYKMPGSWSGGAKTCNGRRNSAQCAKEAREKMYADGPLPFGMAANQGMQGYKTGIWDGNCNGKGNHLMSAIGYGQGYIQVMNSWGKRWGDNGQLKMKDCGVEVWAFPPPIGSAVSSWPQVPGSPGPAPPGPAPGPGPAPPGPSPGPPAPGPAPGPAPRPPSKPIKPLWMATSGPCTVDASGCMMSAGYIPTDDKNDDKCYNSAGKYGPDQLCTFDMRKDTSPAIQVVDFDTEKGADTFTVNGVAFSGSGADIKDLVGAVPKGQMTWTSDKGFEKSGWKLCPSDPRDDMQYMGHFEEPDKKKKDDKKDEGDDEDSEEDYVHSAYVKLEVGDASPWPGLIKAGEFVDGHNKTIQLYMCSGDACGGPGPAPGPAPDANPAPGPAPGPDPVDIGQNAYCSDWAYPSTGDRTGGYDTSSTTAPACMNRCLQHFAGATRFFLKNTNCGCCSATSGTWKKATSQYKAYEIRRTAKELAKAETMMSSDPHDEDPAEVGAAVELDSEVNSKIS